MHVYSRTLFLATAASLAAALPAVAQNAPVTVTIDGVPVVFDQPPVERAGRVFVPLRGVFEKLGASVVYDHGHINATKGATTIALSVGSTSALVNGQQQYLDNPPFLVGARVLVPLRFVSQALGTTVNFVRATRTVAIVSVVRGMPRRTLGAPNGGTPNGGTPNGGAPAGGALTKLSPAAGSTASGHLAQITGAFTADVDPKTFRATLDGSDITPAIFVIGRSFIYYVIAPLPAGKHSVSVSGKFSSGQPATASWSFSTT